MTTESNKLVTIIIPTYNRASTILDCLQSLSKQTYKNIEIIISDDCSTDDTVSKIKAFKDERVKLITHKSNRGPAYARNAAIRRAKGQICFFTDDDVIVPENWIKRGLEYFKSGAVGIEGKIIYVDNGYCPYYSDRIVENLKGGLYMTANAAYYTRTLKQVGMFDTDLIKYQDRDLALRVREVGSIVFASDNPVFHQNEKYTARSYLKEARKVQYWLMLESKSNKSKIVNVYEPSKLAALCVPFIGLMRLRTHRFASKNDWLLLLLLYPRLWYERILVWKYAIKNKELVF